LSMIASGQPARRVTLDAGLHAVAGLVDLLPQMRQRMAGTRLIEDLPYARHGGRALRLDILQPPGPGPHPVLVYLHGGAFAIGSALWGALSGLVGLQVALTASALAMAAGLLLARPFPVRIGATEDVTPASPWHDLFVAEEPEPEAGPVAVEIAYHIRAGDQEAFLDALTQMRAPRRRDGATFWRIYRDLGDPTRYVERFIVASWADYLHQRARATLADQELEARVRAFVPAGEEVTTQHFIAER